MVEWKRWRAWLRAIHRDVGYLAVGFTIIYALSGILMNHIEDWDSNFKNSERSLVIQPIPEDISDEEAVAQVDRVTGFTTKPKDTFRAGDEIRLEYANGAKVTVIGESVTIQDRSSRFLTRAINWLHTARGKAGWKFIADVYAILLVYLAISGIFMIKGRLGWRWRGMILVGVGLFGPVGYILYAGGPPGT